MAAVATLMIGAAAADSGPLAVLVPCAGLWITLYALAGFSDGRRGAVAGERARLLLIALAALYLYPGAPALAAAGYAIVSWIVLEAIKNIKNNNILNEEPTVDYD